MLIVIMLSVTFYFIVILNVVMLSAVMVSVVMLSVAAPFKEQKNIFSFLKPAKLMQFLA
jgi:hypothetical protein